jgi:hypothetical protein
MTRKTPKKRRESAQNCVRRGRPEQRRSRKNARKKAAETKKNVRDKLAELHAELGSKLARKGTRKRVSAAELHKVALARGIHDVPSLATVKRIVAELPAQIRKRPRPIPAIPAIDQNKMIGTVIAHARHF